MPRIILIMVTAASVVAAASCDDSPTVVEYVAPKDEPIQRAAADPIASPASTEQIHWTLPLGWAKQPGSRAMRYATLLGGDDDNQLEVSISMLRGDGGGLLANINRWRTQQMKLERIAAKDVVEHAVRLGVEGSEAFLVDIESDQFEPPRRMLVGIIFRPGGTWFFKSIAGSVVIAEHRAGFLQLLSSVHFVGESKTPPRTPGATAGAVVGATWNVPAGWQHDANPGRMLYASFRFSEGQMAVTRFEGPAGGLLANVNRWRRQLGLAPIDSVGQQPMATLRISGVEGRMIDMGDTKGSGRRFLIATVPHGGFTWFFKMSGPGNVVQHNRRAFDDFLESVVFEQADE